MLEAERESRSSLVKELYPESNSSNKRVWSRAGRLDLFFREIALALLWRLIWRGSGWRKGNQLAGNARDDNGLNLMAVEIAQNWETSKKENWQDSRFVVGCGIREKNESKVTLGVLLWTNRWINMSLIELQSTVSLEAKGEKSLVLSMLTLGCPLVIQVGWRSITWRQEIWT